MVEPGVLGAGGAVEETVAVVGAAGTEVEVGAEVNVDVALEVEAKIVVVVAV